MRRWLGVRAAALLTLLLLASGSLLGRPALPESAEAAPLAQADAPHCAPAQPPRFVFGIEALKNQLGDPMGEPLECEHVNASNGDIHQRTSTGLAYYRPSLGLAIFTNGAQHWTVKDGRLLVWRNGSVTPPEPTTAEADYLNRTAPLRSRYASLQARLDTMRRQAAAGQLDRVEVAALTGLVDELRATRDAYASARVSGRLYRYHGLMVTSVNLAMASAEMLAQARQINPSETQTLFLQKATAHRQESVRRQGAATEAYSQALPVPAS